MEVSDLMSLHRNQLLLGGITIVVRNINYRLAQQITLNLHVLHIIVNGIDVFRRNLHYPNDAGLFLLRLFIASSNPVKATEASSPVLPDPADQHSCMHNAKQNAVTADLAAMMTVEDSGGGRLSPVHMMMLKAQNGHRHEVSAEMVPNPFEDG